MLESQSTLSNGDPAGKVSDQNAAPPSGQILTGKQEHCEIFPSLFVFGCFCAYSDTLVFIAPIANSSSDPQISSANSLPAKYTEKSPSSTPQQHSSASVPRFDQNSAK